MCVVYLDVARRRREVRAAGAGFAERWASLGGEPVARVATKVRALGVGGGALAC